MFLFYTDCYEDILNGLLYYLADPNLSAMTTICPINTRSTT